MSKSLAESLVDKVVKDDRKGLLAQLPNIKFQLLMSAFSGTPFQSAKLLIKHYYCECKIRFTPHAVDTVCFLGADGSGKSTVISSLMNELDGTTKCIDYVHLKPVLGRVKETATDRVTDNPHAKPSRGFMSSVGKLLFWLVLYWKDLFFHGHKNLTLRIWDRYFYDVYIDPKRYRFGAPLWVAKLIGKFVPAPGLIIVLDAPADVIQARKKEVSFEETARQREAYLNFARSQQNSIVLDTSCGIDETVKKGTEAVLEYMNARQKKRMKLK